jgi:anti-anti-sigma factor
MTLTIQNEPGYSCVKIVKKQLNSYNAPDLKAALMLLLSQGISHIVLDLGECEQCDSSGLSAILLGNRLCEDQEGTFILTNLSSSVEMLIKIANLDKVFIIATNVQEAERLLNKKSEL